MSGLMLASRLRLENELKLRSTEKSRHFWNRYFKGTAEFRGVPMAQVRKAVHQWWGEEGFGERPLAEQKSIALELFDARFTEDKLSGVLILAEILLEDLSEADLGQLGDLFAQGHIADWNLCDWFCVKVLGEMVARMYRVCGGLEAHALAQGMSTWREAENLWQRRASCVAFVNLAAEGDGQIPGLAEVILQSCQALVRDPERFAQTGTGWVLRELSVAEPARVVAFVERNLAQFSREGVRYAVKKLPNPERERLLAMHKDTKR